MNTVQICSVSLLTGSSYVCVSKLFYWGKNLWTWMSTKTLVKKNQLCHLRSLTVIKLSYYFESYFFSSVQYVGHLLQGIVQTKWTPLDIVKCCTSEGVLTGSKDLPLRKLIEWVREMKRPYFTLSFLLRDELWQLCGLREPCQADWSSGSRAWVYPTYHL